MRKDPLIIHLLLGILLITPNSKEEDDDVAEGLISICRKNKT